MMKQKEIVAYIESLAEGTEDFFGFQRDTLMGYLKYKHAKPYLLATVTKEEWDEVRFKLDEQTVIDNMHHYMGFAVGKASDHRGLSAGRSVQKMSAYMTLLGQHEYIDWSNYTNYGAPILRQICDRYGWQDLYNTNSPFINMSEGRKCRPICEEGCDA